MATLNSAARKVLGVRASSYIEDHATRATSGRIVVTDLHASKAVSRTITRECGYPYPLNGGEIAYWNIPERFLEEEE